MTRSNPLQSHRSPSDENLVITVIALSLSAITVLGIGSYQFLLYQRERAQERLNLRTYRGYIHHTDQQQAKGLETANAPSPTHKLGQKQIDREMTRKLLDHPAVTPGGGFMAPGVRSTGVAIIDAMDRAHARQR